MQAGLYDVTGNTLIKTWEDLHTEGYLETMDWDSGGTIVMTSLEGGMESYPDPCLLVVNNDITTIQNYAFSGFANLETIIIPDSVNAMDDDLFEYNTALNNIYYSGTATGSPWGATAQVQAYDAFVPGGGTGSTQRVLSEEIGILFANKLKAAFDELKEYSEKSDLSVARDVFAILASNAVSVATTVNSTSHIIVDELKHTSDVGSITSGVFCAEQSQSEATGFMVYPFRGNSSTASIPASASKDFGTYRVSNSTQTTYGTVYYEANIIVSKPIYIRFNVTKTGYFTNGGVYVKLYPNQSGFSTTYNDKVKGLQQKVGGEWVAIENTGDLAIGEYRFLLDFNDMLPIQSKYASQYVLAGDKTSIFKAKYVTTNTQSSSSVLGNNIDTLLKVSVVLYNGRANTDAWYYDRTQTLGMFYLPEIDFTTKPYTTDTLARYASVVIPKEFSPLITVEGYITNNANDAEPVWEAFTGGETHEFTNQTSVNAPAVATRIRIETNDLPASEYPSYEIYIDKIITLIWV